MLLLTYLRSLCLTQVGRILFCWFYRFRSVISIELISAHMLRHKLKFVYTSNCSRNIVKNSFFLHQITFLSLKKKNQLTACVNTHAHILCFLLVSFYLSMLIPIPHSWSLLFSARSLSRVL